MNETHALCSISATARLRCGADGSWRPVDAPGMPACGAHPRVAMLGGEPWFVAADACAGLGIDLGQAAGLLQGVGDGHKSLLPDGDGDLPILSEYAFHTLAFIALLRGLDGAAEGLPEHPFHRWAVESLLPAVRAAAAAQTALPPGALEDTLALALVQRQMRKERRIQRIYPGQPRLLAFLCHNSGGGQWLDVRKPGKLELARLLDVHPDCLGRALDCLVGWGFAERKPGSCSKPSMATRNRLVWPEHIRLNRAGVEAALAEFGLQPPPSWQARPGAASA